MNRAQPVSPPVVEERVADPVSSRTGARGLSPLLEKDEEDEDWVSKGLPDLGPEKTTDALPPSGAAQSQVDQRRDAVTHKNEITKLTTVQHLNVQRCSFHHYSPVVTPRTLPSADRSTKWDTHRNI